MGQQPAGFEPEGFVPDGFEPDPPQGGAMNFAMVNGQRVPVDDGPIDAVKGFAQNINPIPAIQAVGKALIPEVAARAAGAPDANTYGPLNAASGILAAQNHVKQGADEAWSKGDYTTAIRKYADWLLPIIGPAMDSSADKMQAGQTWRGAGEALGLGAALAAPKALEVAKVRVPAVAKNANPVEAAAVQFGEQRGIPVDLATATGNPVIRNVQAATGNMPLGAPSAMRATAAQADALERVGRDLATQTRSAAATPDTAGAGIVDALESKFQAHQDWANKSYGDLRKMAADPKNATKVQTGAKEVWQGALDPQTGAPVTVRQPIYEQMAYPVDLKAAKAALKPIYAEMVKQYPVAQQEASAGFKALGNIVNGKDFMPLTEAEANLSAVKSILRGSGGDTLSMTKSQQLAGREVSMLQAAVDRAAAKGGPKVIRALTEGRSATKLGKATEEVWDLTKREPVATYRVVTSPNDAGIDTLRSLQKQGVQPSQVARAWIDQVLTKATSEGGFDRAKRIQNQWLELGPETKKILFPHAGQITALDNYFRLARMLAENPNPSGTALTGTSLASVQGMFYAPISTGAANIAGGVISAVLRNPKAVRLFTKGASMVLGPGKASQGARALGVADILRAAREAGVTTSASPSVAPGLADPTKPQDQ